MAERWIYGALDELRDKVAEMIFSIIRSAFELAKKADIQWPDLRRKCEEIAAHVYKL